MRLLQVILLLTMQYSVFAQDVPKIELPTIQDTVPIVIQPTVDPVNPIGPVVVSKVKEGTWYVIKSEVPLMLLSFPDGLVSFSQDTGPLRLRGIFADGNGKPETRSLESKYLYFVEAIKPGYTELLIVPEGTTLISNMRRQSLTVELLGPNPPPKPDIVPDPIDPVDPTPTPPTGLRVLMIYNENANRQQLDVVNSTELVKWMTANCAKGADGRSEWRKWDRTSIQRTGVDSETEVWKKLWNKVQPLITQDNMVFVVTDTKVQFVPMTNVADTAAFLQRVKDGK